MAIKLLLAPVFLETQDYWNLLKWGSKTTPPLQWKWGHADKGLALPLGLLIAWACPSLSTAQKRAPSHQYLLHELLRHREDQQVFRRTQPEIAAPSVIRTQMLNFEQALVSLLEVALHELGTMLKARRV